MIVCVVICNCVYDSVCVCVCVWKPHGLLPCAVSGQEVLPEGGGRKFVVLYDARAAREESGQQTSDEAVHVEQRHHDQHLVVWAQLVMAADVVHGCRQIAVCQWHTYHVSIHIHTR